MYWLDGVSPAVKLGKAQWHRRAPIRCASNSQQHRDRLAKKFFGEKKAPIDLWYMSWDRNYSHCANNNCELFSVRFQLDGCKVAWVTEAYAHNICVMSNYIGKQLIHVWQWLKCPKAVIAILLVWIQAERDLLKMSNRNKIQILKKIQLVKCIRWISKSMSCIDLAASNIAHTPTRIRGTVNKSIDAQFAMLQNKFLCVAFFLRFCLHIRNMVGLANEGALPLEPH